MNVANKGIIRKLTMRFLKAGKTRNIIVVIAIALTSLMFTSVFTIGGNMIATIQDQTTRQVGTSSHGGLKHLTMEQYEHFTGSPFIKDISYSKALAVAENGELIKEYTEIGYAENKVAGWQFAYPSTGRMPQAGKEIATSMIVLDALGIPYQIGAEVPVEFTVGGQKYRESFTLVGYWAGDPAVKAQKMWVSEEYVDNLAPFYNPDNDSLAGAVFAELWFGSSLNIESNLLRLIEERGFIEGEINYGVNWAYMMSGDIDPAMIVIILFVLVLILLSGYLIIYSVFAISVKTDIHFYGLLKTVGTTGVQLRRIVRGQAFTLSVAGIPIGMLLGYISGVWLTPALLSTTSFNVNVQSNSTNPLIFIFAAAFSMLTVFIGCRKPGKIAGRVSPVEAVKYSGIAASSKGKTKKTRKVTTLSMAWVSVTREKRKLCVIVLSLSLALILLNGAYSASRSFDMDAYISDYAISNFAVTHRSVFNLASTAKKSEGITQAFTDELTARGIGDIGFVYYTENRLHELSPLAHANFNTQFEEDRLLLQRHYAYAIPLFEQALAERILPTQIYGLSRLPLEFLFPDYDKLAAGDYALTITYSNTPVYGVDDKITLHNEAGEAREFEILAVLDDFPYSINIKHSIIPGQLIILPDNAFTDFFKPQGALYAVFNVPEEDISRTEAWILEYTSYINPELGYTSRDTLVAEFEGMQTTYLVLGGAMAFILALIGVLNFINTVVTSIIARRRELAMLQSVGMTGKQLRETLFFEGMCYTIMTLFFTLTAGAGISRLIVQVIAGQTWFFKEYLTIMPSVYCIIPLFLICAAVPLICYKSLIRESLVERLRVE